MNELQLCDGHCYSMYKKCNPLASTLLWEHQKEMFIQGPVLHPTQHPVQWVTGFVHNGV
jgi:hypothetical protein